MAELERGDGVFPPHLFERLDETIDEAFYDEPRLVVHIDDEAIAAARALYTELLPPGAHVLDLMSSWRSHLPDGLGPVVGLGMNREEMAQNPQLTSHVLQNLNHNPTLPFEDACFDAVVCTVSIQYLVHPLRVFHEVGRVLRPGGVFAVTFSNRCFPTKAIALWRTSSNQQHVATVRAYFDAAGGWTGLADEDRSAGWADPLYAVWARKSEAGQA